jgi:hypothetical protein
VSSRKKRLEALETLYGKRESAESAADEPAILRSPELYNMYINFCRAIGKEPADLDAIRRQYEEDRALGRPRFWRLAAYLDRDKEPD